MLDLTIFLVLVTQNGNTKGSLLLFSIVNGICENYKARSAISLFQMNKFFSHHSRGFKLEISDKRNSCNPIRFPAISNKYSNDRRYDPVLCPKKLIYRQRINGLTKRLILTAGGQGKRWWNMSRLWWGRRYS